MRGDDEGLSGAASLTLPSRQQMDLAAKHDVKVIYSLEFARNMGASWIQLWHHGVVHDAHQEVLVEYRRKFKHEAE